MFNDPKTSEVCGIFCCSLSAKQSTETAGVARLESYFVGSRMFNGRMFLKTEGGRSAAAR
jgi:hypothetical protein